MRGRPGTSATRARPRCGRRGRTRRSWSSRRRSRCAVEDWREHEFARDSLELVVVSFMHPDRDERAAMFERAARALVPGGHLFVTGVHARDHGRRGPPDAGRLHTPERLREALQELFEVLRCDAVSYERELEGELQVVTDVVGIGRRPAP